ncbi:MAG TPA: CpsD/CapB family tyrosine-protein kinase [Acidobacteriaceae bacterium]|nr:CpsD/CapB family tyrosine-protein kinase [Acidobacteriaceae bacterium]
MSKIYEALRQAEVDKGKNGSSAGSSSAAVAPEPVDIAHDPVRTPVFSNTGRALAAVPGSEPQPAGANPYVESRGPVTELSPIGAEALDLSKVPLVTWHPVLERLPALEERGSAVEQFRSLRSRMQEFRDLNTLKSILVSSGLPREGKSFVAINLAVSLARHKAGRVLLIDGDMRRATLHEILGCPITPGLTEYLAGSASILEVMQRPKPDSPTSPVPPGLASLTFIAAGKEHDKAGDLSGNRRFQTLITAVKPYFDWIIVDSSPVNLVSDGVNLARSCDAVLLVARGGITRYEVAQRAVAELKASKILGFVLNAVKNPPIAGGYYGYDGYDKIEA